MQDVHIKYKNAHFEVNIYIIIYVKLLININKYFNGINANVKS